MPEKARVEAIKYAKYGFSLRVEPESCIDALKAALEVDYWVMPTDVSGNLRVEDVSEGELFDVLKNLAVINIVDVAQPMPDVVNIPPNDLL